MAGKQRYYRDRIRSTQALKKIFRAMELMAASRIGKARASVEASGPYARAITRAVSAVVGHAEIDHPLTRERPESRRTAVLLVTSDRGMAGASSAAVLREGERLLRELYDDGADVDLYVTGRRAVSYFTFRRRELAGSWTGFSDSPTSEEAWEIADTLLQKFLTEPADGGVGQLYVVYTHFQNMVTQTPRVIRMLPLEVVEDTGEPHADEPIPLYDFEPSAAAVDFIADVVQAVSNNAGGHVPVSIEGFSRGGGAAGGTVARLFLLSSLAPLGVIVVFYYTSPEYTQPYLPVLFLWIAEGFRLGARAAADRLAQLSPPGAMKRLSLLPLTVAAAAVFASVPLARQVTAEVPKGPYDPQSDQCRRDHKNIGLLLKQHLPPGKIMTRWARVAFYADRDWVNFPNAGVDEILRAARENGVRFIVVDGGLFLSRPELGSLLFPLQFRHNQEELTLTPDNYVIPDSGLRPYLMHIGPETSGVRVYEIAR